MDINCTFQLLKDLRETNVTRLLRIEVLEKVKANYEVIAEFSGDYKELAEAHIKKLKKENPEKYYKVAKIIRLEMSV